MKVKEESEKAGLKFSIQKTKIMASSSTTAWQIDGETIGTATDFIFLGSKITADGDCSREVKRRLLHGRKAVTNLSVQFSSVQSLSRVWLFTTPWTNLYSILKSRDITLPTKVRLVKTMVFPVVMYRCESWTIKKVERWRIELLNWVSYWRRPLRVL